MCVFRLSSLTDLAGNEAVTQIQAIQVLDLGIENCPPPGFVDQEPPVIALLGSGQQSFNKVF